MGPKQVLIMNANGNTDHLAGTISNWLLNHTLPDSFLEILSRRFLGTMHKGVPYPAEIPPTRIPDRLLARSASSSLPCTALDSEQTSTFYLYIYIIYIDIDIYG